MKKIIFTTSLAFTSLFVNAQLKVYTSGKTYLGGTLTTPLSTLDVSGNATIGSYAGSTAAPSNGLIVSGNVGIGTSSPYSALSIGGPGSGLYKLYVYNSLTNNTATGIRAEVATPTTTSYWAYAASSVITCGTGYSVGSYGSSYQASAGGGRSYGVYGLAGNATGGYNYGVYGSLGGTNSGAAIYGTEGGDVDLDGGSYGSTNTFAGFFNGDLLTTDDAPEKPNAGSWAGYSDKRLKKDIAPFNDGLNVLRQINPVSYQFNGIGMLPTGKSYIGVIAQDIKQFAPYCIGESSIKIKQSESSSFSADGDVFENIQADTAGIAKSIVKAYTFNYDGLIYVLINSVKQLDSTITEMQANPTAKKAAESNDSLMQEIEKLKELVNQCCTSPYGNSTGDNNNSKGNIQVELANKNNIVLYQNEPNPFSNQTIIRYFVPENVTEVFVIFHDEFGREVSKVRVTEKGFGKIEANTENLASGVYTYSIVAGGKTMDTKKMLKTK